MEEIIKNESEEKKSVSFIEQKVINDLAEGKNGGRLQTRFPSVWPRNMVVYVTSVSMTLILSRKIQNISTASRMISSGWDSSGLMSIMPATISRNYGILPFG